MTDHNAVDNLAESSTKHDEFVYEAVSQALGRLTEVRESRTPVEFTVKDGVVTVSGVAFTEILRRRILYAIAISPGVTKVIDRLYDDDDLKVYAAQALAGEDVLGDEASNIIVSSYQGIITINGEVSNDEKRQKAVDAILEVNGVRSVVDQLIVPEAA